MKIRPSLTIDTDRLVAQHQLISMLIENLSDGHSETVGLDDLNELIGIQGILNTLSDYADYKPCIDKDAIADLARKTINMDVVENALIDFWSSPEGADDLSARISGGL